MGQSCIECRYPSRSITFVKKRPIEIKNRLEKRSSLVYPITWPGRWGTTDDFATIPFHLVLYSAALVEQAMSIPVHSLILSSHLFFCLLLLLFPFTVPCKIVFAKPEDLEIWTNHLSFHFLTMVRRSSYSSIVAWIFLQIPGLVTWSLYGMFNNLSLALLSRSMILFILVLNLIKCYLKD